MPFAAPNRLLASLTPTSRQRLESLCSEVELPVNTVLYEADQGVEHAYFLHSGFASQVLTLGDSGSVEIGIVGCEGVVGGTALLGGGKAPGRCFMQAQGRGYVIPLPALQGAFDEVEEIRMRILQFLQEHMLTVTYLSACNKLHDTEPRFARWLLMVQDRLETDVLPLRQEFVAQMLGTRRMTVTTVAGALQRSGMIEYNRGQIRILDRASLEQTACECYGHIKQLYDGLYR